MQTIPAVPLSMKRLEDEDIIPISSKEELETLLQGKQLPRVASLPAGEIQVSFNLPQDLCLHGLDLEKLQPLGDRSASTSTDRQFTISERLSGWKINRRQRIKEPHHYDTVYSLIN
ncbi:hypothetical protein M0R45_006049 [Rubus argutus]|uniref:Uncharacterized protein n=1 Tax=Rubus argutus TaxID=59490 RepID=A0AAW1YPN6_RUBAR